MVVNFVNNRSFVEREQAKFGICLSDTKFLGVRKSQGQQRRAAAI